MENGLFRKKSLERISSPEEMHDYMRVTSPRLWMLLSAIVILLVGFIAYASSTTLENTIPLKVYIEKVKNYNEQGEATGSSVFVYSEVPVSNKDMIEPGMEVRIGSEKGKVSWIANTDGDDNLTVVIDMEHPSISWPEGEQEAVLVLESTTPIKFLWN